MLLLQGQLVQNQSGGDSCVALPSHPALLVNILLLQGQLVQHQFGGDSSVAVPSHPAFLGNMILLQRLRAESVCWSQ